MYPVVVSPRFNETDALGHINNTVIAAWFEGARDAVFRVFTEDLDTANWRLILAKFSVEFHAELFYGHDVTIHTEVSRIGNSSFDVSQQAWQQGRLCASGVAVLVHYDFQAAQSTPLTDHQRQRLQSL